MPSVRTMYRVFLAILSVVAAAALALATTAAILAGHPGAVRGPIPGGALGSWLVVHVNALWGAFGLTAAIAFAHGVAGPVRLSDPNGADAQIAGAANGQSEHVHSDNVTLAPPASSTVRRAVIRNVDTLGDEVQEAYLLQRRMLRGIGHDLRSPLASIAFTSETMAAGALGPLTDEQADALRLTAATAHRLATQAEVLYAYDEGRRGVDEAAREAVNVTDSVTNVVTGLQAAATARGLALDLRVTCAPATCAIRVDHRILERAVANLVDNAIKFTDHGAITVTVASEGEQMVVVTVADTGVGIAPEHLSRVTEVYFRAPETAGRPGTGIGLAVTREFAAEMGGELTITSEVGRGTTVALQLPTNR